MPACRPGVKGGWWQQVRSKWSLVHRTLRLAFAWSREQTPWSAVIATSYFTDGTTSLANTPDAVLAQTRAAHRLGFWGNKEIDGR
jgi:hypothetical protein